MAAFALTARRSNAVCEQQQGFSQTQALGVPGRTAADRSLTRPDDPGRSIKAVSAHGATPEAENSRAQDRDHRTHRAVCRSAEWHAAHESLADRRIDSGRQGKAERLRRVAVAIQLRFGIAQPLHRMFEGTFRARRSRPCHCHFARRASEIGQAGETDSPHPVI